MRRSRHKHIMFAFCLIVFVPSCTSDTRQCVQADWLWEFVPPPDRDGDGFNHLDRAVDAYMITGVIDNEVRDLLASSANSAAWTGIPNMRSYAITGDVFSSQLISTDSGSVVIEYRSLRKLLQDFASSAENYKNDQAEESAVVMIKIGYQLSRNGEDSWTGVMRLTLWEKGFSILSKRNIVNMSDSKNIRSNISNEFNWIRSRDSNKLYLMCE